MTKQAKKTETTKNTARTTKGKALAAPAKRTKQADVVPLEQPKVLKGSVVPAQFKTKAGKAGIMNGDDLGMAVKNAFLAHGSNDRTAQESARLAVDELLADNGLDAGRWAGKNPGMLRMNITNVLRGIRRNGESVIVRGKAFKPHA